MKESVKISADAAVTNAPPPVRRSSSVLPWLGLVSILVLYALCVARLHPTNFFGLTEDDSIYFSSAKALAEGKGYILPSVPGTPPATKYPILYPWMLSWVWRWNPSFPANLSAAVALNVAFGAAYLTMAFVFLRRLKGLNDVAALTLTGYCAVHPLILFQSAHLMSDIPFAALTLGACVQAARAIEKDAGTRSTVFCGILAGLAALARVLGVPIAAGLYWAIALRKGWRKSTVFAACVLPFLATLLWRLIFLTPKIAAVAASSCSISWRMTWLYYTSYIGYWRADTVSHHVLWQTVRSGLFYSLIQPGAYFLNSHFIQPATLAVVLLTILSAVAARGLVRQARAGGLQPVHFALAFYLLPVLIWDYATVDRFLIPFLPLIGAGVWTEASHLAHQIRISFQKEGGREEKIASTFFCLVGAAILLCMGVSWVQGIFSVAHVSESRAALLKEKREAYAWLRENSSPNARVLAYEDASAYLYSARQALRPTIFSPSGVYRPEVLNSELSCITSSAEPISAGYWLVSDDDFGFEWEPANSRAKLKETQTASAFPLLFRSRQGHVRIYGLVPGEN